MQHFKSAVLFPFNQNMASSAAQATTILTLILFFKYFYVLRVQAGARGRAGKRLPEDYRNGAPQVSQEHLEINDRWQSIVQNDLEQIPFGLVIALLSLFFGSNIAHIVFMTVWTASRILHTTFYAKSKQPHRFFAFAGGLTCVVGMGVNAIVGSFVY